jgi:hypothetical protein
MEFPGRVVRVEPGVGFGLQFGEMGSETRHQLGQQITQIGRQAAARGPGSGLRRLPSVGSRRRSRLRSRRRG